ncbi:3'-5' exonuclease [Aquisalimonas sp.]|uniref:3'-5' exonuclease n=1 Tax=Aquisalimonas sp. TaxID=1872621 RepID=UPI0034567F71
MQDDTPVQYAALARLFPCNKTILGDANQSINPHGASKADDIQAVFNTASCVTLHTSYRSSYEITQFAQHISPNPDLVAIERHGEEPQVVECRTKKEEMARLVDDAEAFRESAHNTLGVICKTPKQARRMARALGERDVEVHLFEEQRHTYATGVIVCTAHMAKGLEFDQVIVPDVGAGTYHSPMDRNLLYVGGTRAMHRVVLTHTGAMTPFLQTP